MKEFPEYNDEKLLQDIKAGNMLAFDRLYKKYSNKIFRFGFSIIKSQAETENLVQDVFLSLWENRHKVEKDSSIKSYVFTIAYNSAISSIRKKAKELQFMEYLKTIQEINEEPINLKIEYDELTSKLDHLIETLPPRQKEIFKLCKVEGLKYREIADRLHISENTIENHMSKALNTIRKNLGNRILTGLLFWHLFISC